MVTFVILTGEMIKAGRALCRMDQAELARLAGISLQTIKRLEHFRGPIEANIRTMQALISAFQARGVVFELVTPSMGALKYRFDIANDVQGATGDDKIASIA